MREWYPGYVSAPPRTDEQIEMDLNRRCGYLHGEVRIIDPALASPAPVEVPIHPTKFIQYVGKKRRTPGLDGACGLNAAGKKRKEPKQ